MNDSPLTRTDFLALSTRLCDDLRRWVAEAIPYHSLTPDELALLEQAAQLLDQATVALAAKKAD